MPLKSRVSDVYADVPFHLRWQYNDFIRVAERFGDAQPGDGAFPLSIDDDHDHGWQPEWRSPRGPRGARHYWQRREEA